MGFECIKPEGAFYLFVKSPVEDEKAFCAAAKKYNILIVPGSCLPVRDMCVWHIVFPMRRL